MDIDQNENDQGIEVYDHYNDDDEEEVMKLLKTAAKQADDHNAARMERRRAALERRKAWWTVLENAGLIQECEKEATLLVWKVFKTFFPVSGYRSFVTKIGVDPNVIGRIIVRYWSELEERKVDVHPLLVTFNSWAEVITLDSLAANWRISRSTASRWIADITDHLYELLDEVHWEKIEAWHTADEILPQGPNNMFRGSTFSIDGTECPISKPASREENAIFFSGKQQTWTIKYEVCTHISSGRIMWFAGGVPGSISDKSLTEVSGVLNAIPPGEKGITDKGYEGLDKSKFLIMLKRQRARRGQPKVALAADEQEYNRRISSLRIEVERVNARLKNFGVLRMSRIRSKWLHKTIFSIICNVVNIQMELQPMRKSIHEYIFQCDYDIPRRAQPPLPQ